MANLLDAFVELQRLELVHRRERKFMRILRRNLRDSFNPFEMPEARFQELFRLSKEASRYVITVLRPHLEPQQRTTQIPLHLKVLATLNFLGSGSYQRRVGQDFSAAMSQTMISRSVNQICLAMNRAMLDQWVEFPLNQNKRNAIKEGFMDKFGFPGVIGCVDGTHVAIVTPTLQQQEHLYVNRKSYHSINVMLICDSNLRILAMNALHPGSHHDSFVFNSSAVYAELLRRFLA